MSAPPRSDRDAGSRPAESFAERYRRRFLAYLESGDETDIAPAYEMSREAVAEGLSLLELAEAHREAIACAVLPEPDAARRELLAERAAGFLRESLATFEIAHRGYVEVQESARIQQEHARKLQAIAEVSAALNASLPVGDILALVTREARRLLDAAFARAEVNLDRPAAAQRGTLAASAGTPPADGDSDRSRLRAPLTGRRGAPVGLLEVTGVGTPDAGAEAILAQLAQVASAAIDNAQLYGLKREIAETLQRSLLPNRLPRIEGLDVHARYVASGDGMLVGGDFYDVFATNGASWGIAIGDVCGKGPQAAALTALVRYTLRAAALWERNPERVMRLLNEAIIDQRSDYRFCTALYGELRPHGAGARLDFVTCGHPHPLLVRDGEVQHVGSTGTLLGVVPDPVLHGETLELVPGDLLVLFTDGAVEVRRGGREVFGLDDLRALLAGLGDMPAAIVAGRVEEAVLEASGGPPRDDLAVIALRIPR